MYMTDRVTYQLYDHWIGDSDMEDKLSGQYLYTSDFVLVFNIFADLLNTHIVLSVDKPFHIFMFHFTQLILYLPVYHL